MKKRMLEPRRIKHHLPIHLVSHTALQNSKQEQYNRILETMSRTNK